MFAQVSTNTEPQVCREACMVWGNWGQGCRSEAWLPCSQLLSHHCHFLPFSPSSAGCLALAPKAQDRTVSFPVTGCILCLPGGKLPLPTSPEFLGLVAGVCASGPKSGEMPWWAAEAGPSLLGYHCRYPCPHSSLWTQSISLSIPSPSSGTSALEGPRLYHAALSCVVWPVGGSLLFSCAFPYTPSPGHSAPNLQSSGEPQEACSVCSLTFPSWGDQGTCK